MIGGSDGSSLGPNALILALLAFLGIGAPALTAIKGATSSVTATPRVSLAPTPGTGSYSHSAVGLLEKFFGTNSAEVSDNRPWQARNPPSIPDPARLPVDASQQFAISFLIETVPAATSASLRHDFDSYLNAIQMAAGRAGYVLDSFDLPWLEKGTDHQNDFRIAQPIDLDWNQAAEPPIIGADRGKGAVPAKGSEIQPARHGHIMVLRPDVDEETDAARDPAVLLFRNDDGINKRLLVVFLVDETPTRGINKAAMGDALDQIAWLSGWKTAAASPPQYLVEAACKAGGGTVEETSGMRCSTKPREIRIVGPTFSGSALSLRNALIEWLGLQKIDLARISIISGTATAIGDQLSLSRTDGTPALEFHSVRIADSTIWKFARPFLHAQGNQGHPGMAVLSDNTSYGSGTTGQAPGLLHIIFPVHISNLRYAVSRADQASTSSGPGLGRHDIPIGDEGKQREGDVIPLFSSRSATYDELVLENLLSTLSTERIRSIGIVATDVEDLVFLVHEIRRACPNTVVFTTSADLRYIHSDVNPDLVGMLVFSTYPLFGLNQMWTYPFTGLAQRIQFPGEDAEGVFNATAAQLDQTDEMEEYGAPFAPSRASRDRTPALWVGVVGHDAIWPVRFQIENGVENLYAPPTFRSATPMVELVNLYPLSFQIAFLVICLGCLIPAAGMLRPKLFTVTPPSPGSARSWPEALFGDAVFPEFHQERWMRVSAFLGALLIALVVGVGYFLLPLRSASLFGGIARTMSPSLPVALATVLAILVTIPVILAAIVAALLRIQDPPSNPGQQSTVTGNLTPTGAQFALVGTIVGLVLVTVFVTSQWWQPPGFTLLNFIRAANLGNGVSPLTPLIFLGIANLCLIGGDLWRLRLIEDCRVKLPFLNFEAGAQSFRGTDALEAQVINFLECTPWELPGTWFLIAVLAVSFVYFACSRGLPLASIDGWNFNVLFFLSAAFIYFYFSILMLRFMWIWRELHRLLRRLYWHPTRGAYSLLRARSLPESSGQTIRLIEPRPSLTAMEFCLQCAREIVNLLDHPEGGGANEPKISGAPLIGEALGEAIRFAEGGMAAVLAAQSRSDWQSAIRLRMMAQEAIARLSGQVTALLEPAWRLLLDSPQPSLPEHDQKMIEWGDLFVASRVVDFLRQVFPQMRVLSGSAMAGLLAMMLAASVYPFVQRDLLLWVSWIVLLTAIAIGVTIFVQISRSRIVSMLYGTTPGRFSWDSAFTVRLLMFGVIPILTLLGAQYPNTLGGIISWLGRLVGGAPAQ